MSGLAGIVLAGGSGRRLGEVDKALLVLGGERLVDRVLREVTSVAEPVVLVRGERPPVTGVHVPQLADAVAGAGPLAGLVSGLEAVTGRPAAAVVAVDTPGVSGGVLRHLEELRGDADVCLPVVDGRRQPLHAVVATRAATPLRAALESGERGLLAALSGLSVREVTEAELAAAGLDTGFADDVDVPDDLRRWLRR